MIHEARVYENYSKKNKSHLSLSVHHMIKAKNLLTPIKYDISHRQLNINYRQLNIK